MIKNKNIRSELVFEQKERIKCIEFVYEDKKFVVLSIKDNEPLFQYLMGVDIHNYNQYGFPRLNEILLSSV
jgi:hypothetical protein